MTQPALAEAFRLSEQSIQNICSGKGSYRHLKPITRENGAGERRRKFDAEQVTDIREARQSGETLKQIAERYDVNPKLIWTVVHGHGLYATN